MSLELKIEALTAAVITLTAKMESGTVTPAAAPVAVVELVPVVKPVVESIPVVVTPQMPAPPSFVTPQAVFVPQNGAPFTDPKGLIDFVMTSYKNLGPAKGAGIQGVLTGLGYQNINDVKAEHYATLFCGIEGLKG